MEKCFAVLPPKLACGTWHIICRPSFFEAGFQRGSTAQLQINGIQSPFVSLSTTTTYINPSRNVAWEMSMVSSFAFYRDPRRKAKPALMRHPLCHPLPQFATFLSQSPEILCPEKTLAIPLRKHLRSKSPLPLFPSPQAKGRLHINQSSWIRAQIALTMRAKGYSQVRCSISM